MIIARTGAVRHEGLDAAIDRLRAYRAAGADALMLFCSGEQLATVADRVEGPFATITTLDRHPREMWGSTGWSLVIDAFAGQAVPIQALRDAYRRYLDEGTLGVDLAGMDLHRELVELCGLQPLLDVERRTTERGQGCTTIELDDETAKAVADLRRERGVGTSEAVNTLIRHGLLHREPTPASDS